MKFIFLVLVFVSNFCFAAGTGRDSVPAGMVMAYVGTTCPNGWLPLDGSTYSRTTYAQLFAAAGTIHGSGDGSTTFGLPDARGIFISVAGSQTVGSVTYSKTLGTKQNDQMQGHYHRFAGGYYNVGSSAPYLFGPASSAVGAGDRSGSNLNSSESAYMDNTVRSPVTDGTNGTPRSGVETRPANLSLTHCVKI